MNQKGASLHNNQRRQRALAAITASVFLAPLTGCGHSNEINVVGAYFPLWLVALIVGVAAAFAARYLFVRVQIEPYVGPLVLIYVCITVSVSCLTWLLFV